MVAFLLVFCFGQVIEKWDWKVLAFAHCLYSFSFGLLKGENCGVLIDRKSREFVTHTHFSNLVLGVLDELAGDSIVLGFVSEILICNFKEI